MADAQDIAKQVEAVFRIEQPRLIGGLVRMVRDVAQAEDLAQEALVAALTDWPRNGVPAAPGAWLMATAKRRAIDGFRRREMLARKHAEIGRDAEADRWADLEARDSALDDPLGDEVLGLIFTACHPVLAPHARAALTLRLIGGLTTEEIARAFLSTPPTVAQRITRAKATLAAADIAYEVPRGAELGTRRASVLEVIYLIFNEGYSATAGEDAMRPALCAEAQRLGRLLCAAMPEAAEAQGLLALMELQASRLRARTAPDGSLVPLPQQDRARWDRLLIQRGLAALGRAEALGGADHPYVLQAAIAACHARALRPGDTDWGAIATLYDRLVAVLPSPVVGLNRAVAYSMASGPEAGLRLLADVEATGTLARYAPLPAARGDFLFRAGRLPEARVAFEAAAELTRNAAERHFLQRRAADCG